MAFRGEIDHWSSTSAEQPFELGNWIHNNALVVNDLIDHIAFEWH
jgi:hypothetical protein